MWGKEKWKTNRAHRAVWAKRATLISILCVPACDRQLLKVDEVVAALEAYGGIDIKVCRLCRVPTYWLIHLCPPKHVRGRGSHCALASVPETHVYLHDRSHQLPFVAYSLVGC